MRFLLFVAFNVFSISCYAQTESVLDKRIKRIENNLQPVTQRDGEDVPSYNIEDRLRMLGIPGLSIAVVSDGKIEWAKGYGIADISNNRAVDVDTLFLAGSISKPISAVRAHQLVEDGIIDLDSNVNDYLTSWKLPDNQYTTIEKVTLRRILNHTAGLTVWGFPGYDIGDDLPTVIQVLNGEGNTDPVRVYKKPGESWMYSGGGYTIMQLMISDVENNQFSNLMKMNVLEPLGMTKSTFENPLPENYHSLAASGYRPNGQEVEGKWPIYPEMAAAGLWTSPSQLIRYAIEVQSILQTQTDGILKKGTVAAMLTPGLNGHGLGPNINEYTFGHNGADEGFRASLLAWKDSANAVVVMVNSDNGSIISEVMLAIAKEYQLPGVATNILFEIEEGTTADKLSNLTGLYELYPDFTFEITSENDRLFSKGTNQPRWEIFSKSDTEFYYNNVDAQITFDIDDSGIAIGLTLHQNGQDILGLKLE